MHHRPKSSVSGRGRSEAKARNDSFPKAIDVAKEISFIRKLPTCQKNLTGYLWFNDLRLSNITLFSCDKEAPYNQETLIAPGTAFSCTAFSPIDSRFSCNDFVPLRPQPVMRGMLLTAVKFLGPTWVVVVALRPFSSSLKGAPRTKGAGLRENGLPSVAFAYFMAQALKPVYFDLWSELSRSWTNRHEEHSHVHAHRFPVGFLDRHARFLDKTCSFNL